MDDKYNKRGKSYKIYLFETRRIWVSACSSLSAMLINRVTRTPTFFGWIFIIGVTFILANFLLRKKTTETERPDMGKFTQHGGRKGMYPRQPDLQEQEFKAIHEQNMKGEGIPKLPVFDPNKHDNVAHKLDDEGKVQQFGFPKPKEFPVVVVARPDVGCSHQLTLLLLVHTHPSQTGARSAIRRAWTSLEQNDGKPAWETIFVMGRGNNRFDKISEEEATTHNDMLIGDFKDSPLEGTRKFMLGMQWITENLAKCIPHFVVRTEDKVFMNINVILPWLKDRFTDQKNIYTGKLTRNDIPVRDPKDPHHVTLQDFPDAVFPDFIQAPVYMFSADVVIKLAKEMKWTTPIVIEDAFVGILAKKAGIKPRHNDHFQMLRKPDNMCRYLHTFFLFNTLPHEHLEIAKTIQNARQHCGDVQIVDARKGFHKLSNNRKP